METQKIFLSYSRDDSEFVLKLAQDLRSAGANVWLDQLDIPVGNRWDLAIEKALADAYQLIVILSESSVASNNVMDEVSYALEGGKTVFPVVLNRCNIPFRLKRLQFIDFTIGYDKGLTKLLTDLGVEQRSAIETPAPDKQADRDILLTHTPKKKNGIENGKGKRRFFLKWEGISALAIAILIAFIGLNKFLLSNATLPQSDVAATLPQKDVAKLPNIRAWKVGSPHKGDIPDSTPPFDLQREANKMGFNLSVEGLPANGFAARFFEAIEKHEEPDILVIDNYGIIDGISTSSTIKNSLVFVAGSLKEFESDRGGWQLLVSTSRNHQAVKSLALRQPHCDPELKTTLEEIPKTIAAELHKYTLKYILESDLFKVRLGSDFSIAMCGFWGNKNTAFLHSIVTYDAEKKLGWSDVLVIMAKKDSSWELINLGGNVDLIKELNKGAKLVDASPDPPLQNDFKIIGPADGAKFPRFPTQASLEWEWSGDVNSIACYLIESQFESNKRWSESYFTLVSPQESVKLVAPFGFGAQPHRWKVWAIDKRGSIVRSSWRTIIYTN